MKSLRGSNADLHGRQQPPQSGSIMHALSKADHIQELIISHDDPQGDHRSNYNAAILDSLESLLSSTPKLVSVTLKSDVRQLSASFWNTLLSKHLRHLEVQGWKSISDDYQVLAPLVLDKFVLCYHQRTSRLLDASLDLIWSSIDLFILTRVSTGCSDRKLVFEICRCPPSTGSSIQTNRCNVAECTRRDHSAANSF
jgi:hypothetical protein